MSKILLVIKSAPYGGERATEGLRIATAMIAMDVLPQILFLDDGVYCLVKNQTPEAIDLESFTERLTAISDLIGVHVLSDSLEKRKVKKDDLEDNYKVTTLTLDETTDLFAQCDSVITF